MPIVIKRIAPACACGCGEKVNRHRRNKRWSKYIQGHNRRGVKLSEETRKRMSKPTPEEVKKKISIAKMGTICSDEHRRKMVIISTGKRASIETLLKISGPNHHSWKGGSSSEPYCAIWSDKEYKKSIRERDEYTCQNPDCWGTSRRLAIHHINYIKKNCHPQNLITLCTSCNTRANKNRKNHIKIYQDIMTKKYQYKYN